MDASRKKELVNTYKQRDIAGGVYAIVCSPTGNRLLDAAVDLAGAENRFQFSVNTNLCPHHSLQKDWREYGSGSFSFEVVETLPKKEEETMQEYRESLKALLKMVLQEGETRS